MAVLDGLPPGSAESPRGRRWLRRRSGADLGETPEPGEHAELRTTPAADVSLSEAARLAGSQPVGSHHLLLAALGDPKTAAARALAALGVDLDQAREALRTADVTGSSDEQPEEAGRRQMLIRVTGQQLTIEATDPVIVDLGRAALAALGEPGAPSEEGGAPGEKGSPAGVIRGDLPTTASLANVWQALHDSLETIERRATSLAASPAALDVQPRGTARED
ncbi:MAG: Clp protease N-terminal domain-containing protein [Streptosporangiaceae bacterium]